MSGEKMETITPDTKIGALLDDFPELEPVLMKLSPKFEKLKNPVLRKTVAKVANLRQVAKVGGVSLSEMINALRRAVGMDELVPGIETVESGAVPVWFHPDVVYETLDIRPVIDAGKQPISIVMEKLNNMGPGHILKVIAPFEPAPLIDLVKQKRFEVHLQKENESQPVACFFRKPA